MEWLPRLQVLQVLLVLQVVEEVRGVPCVVAQQNMVPEGQMQDERGECQVSAAKKIKSKMAGIYYIQRVKHRIVMKLHLWKLNEEYCRRLHH